MPPMPPLQPIDLKRQPFLKDLESLRGVAIGLVFFTHVNWKFPGWIGVYVFFVISGFVVTRSLLSLVAEFEASGQAKKTDILKVFYLRRFFRIFPVAFAIAALYLLISLLMPAHQHFADFRKALTELYYAVTLQLNYRFARYEIKGYLSPLWSLNVEEQFYLFLPFLMLFLKTNRAKIGALCLGVFSVMCFLRPYLLWNVGGRHASYLLFSVADHLLVGVLLALFLQPRAWGREKTLSRGNPFLSSCLSLSALWGIMACVYFIPNEYFLVYGNPPVWILSAVLVWLSNGGKAFLFLPPVLEKALGWIGKHSYAIYLVHYPVIQIYDELTQFWGFHQNFLGRFLFWGMGRVWTTLLVTLLVSACLRRWVELPCLAWGKRFISSRWALVPPSSEDLPPRGASSPFSSSSPEKLDVSQQVG